MKYSFVFAALSGILSAISDIKSGSFFSLCSMISLLVSFKIAIHYDIKQVEEEEKNSVL